MIIEKYWSVTLKSGIYGGLKPTEDQYDDTVFYIGDGWGSAYPSMKFRKLSVENGTEVANCSVKKFFKMLLSK